MRSGRLSGGNAFCVLCESRPGENREAKAPGFALAALCSPTPLEVLFEAGYRDEASTEAHAAPTEPGCTDKRHVESYGHLPDWQTLAI
jgi:hypothetical protein